MNYIIEKATTKRKGFNFHSHLTYELIIFKKGFAFFNYENKKVNVKAGDVIIIPPSVIHCITSDENEFEYYYFSGIDTPFFNDKQPLFLSLGEDNEAIILTNLIHLNRYLKNENYLNSLINSLILYLSKQKKKRCL
jgi:gentisate 1,2-dioxygenase